MSRHVCITACEGHTGFLIAELLLTDANFKNSYDSIAGLSMNPNSDHCRELNGLGMKIFSYECGRVTDTLRETGADTLCLIPPVHRNKAKITTELIESAKEANIQNILFISVAGCDLAERDSQPRLREFIDFEARFLSTKGDPSTTASRSLVVIRAGFYAENLLLYAPQAREEGLIPIPVGPNHKFPPVALGDVAQLAAHVLISKGKNGFSEKVRGQLMTMTGPMLLSGSELATAASHALGVEMKFDDITEAKAEKVLHGQTDNDESEIQLILEYYSLVREGKTNYISTTAFHDVTGTRPQEPPDFFKTYAEEFMPKKAAKRRKTDGK